MQYINLGNTGLRISRICLGMMTYGSPQWRKWVLDEEAARPIVRRAVELGINFFDTADMYSAGISEELTGKLLRECTQRDEVVIATKVYFPVRMDYTGTSTGGPLRPNESGLSRKRIFAAVDASLKRLGTDHIDLYQIHRWDYHTPIEETMEALNDVVRAGKVRYIGASSMWAWQFAKAQETARAHGWACFVSMQNHYNLLYREEEREMIPLCRDQGVGVIPWSPLARGYLAGNRGRGEPATVRAGSDELAERFYGSEDDFAVIDRLVEVARNRGESPARIAYAWLLHRPGISAPIIGASKLTQLEDAVRAIEVVLDADELRALEEPYRPHPVLGHS